MHEGGTGWKPKDLFNMIHDFTNKTIINKAIECMYRDIFIFVALCVLIIQVFLSQIFPWKVKIL